MRDHASVRCYDCGLGTLALLRPRPDGSEADWVCYDCVPQTPDEMRSDLDEAGIFTNMVQMEGDWVRITVAHDGQHWTLDNRARERTWTLRRGRAGWGEELYTTPFADPLLIDRMGGTAER